VDRVSGSSGAVGTKTMCRLHAGTALKREAVAADASYAMNRGTGTGLIVFGVILGVVGAIMAFAITVHTRGFNINTAGWILLVVGVVVLVIGIAIFVTGSRRSSTTVENVQSTPSGQERVEERRDWGSP
jgi:protein-S-isoprenylcysteine O-methyltransferase Ste14